MKGDKNVNGTGGAEWADDKGTNSRKATAEAAGITEDCRKRGGRVMKKAEKHVKMDDSKKAMMRLDRPGRKRGGRVGAEMSPLSEASKVS
jgi:hypothetical protein